MNPWDPKFQSLLLHVRILLGTLWFKMGSFGNYIKLSKLISEKKVHVGVSISKGRPEWWVTPRSHC